MAKTTSESVNPVISVPVQAEEKVVAPEPVIAPAAVEAPAEEPKEPEVTIYLDTQFTNNRAESEGGMQHFGPGTVTVPQSTADDLVRRNRDFMQGEKYRLEGHDKTSGHIGEIG